MRCSAERLIEALIAKEIIQMQHSAAREEAKRNDKKEIPVVTVSRDFGSLGKEVAQLLADSLEVRCCDRYILQEVARRAHVDEELVGMLDEHISKIKDHWWQNILHKDGFTYEDYYQYLVKTILSISQKGGVIVGRGANHILGADKAFRVRIIGSENLCAARVELREGITEEESIKRVRTINAERAEYIKMLYNTDINDDAEYDIILNSDRFGRVQMVHVILDAMEQADYRLPRDARKSLDALSRANG